MMNAMEREYVSPPQCSVGRQAQASYMTTEIPEYRLQLLPRSTTTTTQFYMSVISTAMDATTLCSGTTARVAEAD
jgi:hypothetical protein